MRDEEFCDLEGLLPAPTSWFHPGCTSRNGMIVSCFDDNEKISGRQVPVEKLDKATANGEVTIQIPLVTPPLPHYCSSKHIKVLKPAINNDDRAITANPKFLAKEIEDGIRNGETSLPTESSRQEGRLPQSTQRRQHIGAPLPSPSWTEISSVVLPAAGRELLSNSMRRLYHSARLSYAITTEWRQQYKELGNPTRGYFRNSADSSDDLPPFSSLPWIERQMVQEWRTYSHGGVNPQQPSPNDGNGNDNLMSESSSEIFSRNSVNSSIRSPSSSFDSASSNEAKFHENERKDDEEDEDEFLRARTLVPRPKLRPKWQHAETCFTCYKPFGPTRLRHHCRLCGYSFCQAHSSHTHPLPHLGYLVPERVCDGCRTRLLDHELAERVAWRLARCRDLTEETLCPFFEIGVDTMHDMAVRITEAAWTMAKSIPLGAQATVAVETLEVLRRYGLNGIFTILLRQDFLAAADMLRKALGIDSKSWPLSVHELSAAIFYALAQHRAFRGLHPEREHEIHALRTTTSSDGLGLNEPSSNTLCEKLEEGESACATQANTLALCSEVGPQNPQLCEDSCLPNKLVPVCEKLPESTLNALIFYAPLALSFIYADKEVDMQLLAAQQGWRLLYAHLQPKVPHQDAAELVNRPSSAVFVHEKHRIACLSIRGTTTIHDVVTDIRQVPVPFPEPEMYKVSSEDWTTMSDTQGLAVSGMVGAALNLYREHVDSLLYLAFEGYRIRLVGHSLGGAVAALIGVLLRHDFPALNQETSPKFKQGGGKEDSLSLRVYTYGSPACVDARLSDIVQDFAVAVVLHDDAVPRLNPASCRGLLKHLLHIRQTWVKEHLPNDLMAITERAKLAWAPRWREGFTLLCTPSSSSIKRYYRKQFNKGKNKILSMKDTLLKVADEKFGSSAEEPVKYTSEQGSINRRTSDETHQPQASMLFDAVAVGEATSFNSEASRLVDYMGGIDYQKSGVVIDGDEFFEAYAENLVEDETNEEGFEDAVHELVHQQEKEISSFVLQENAIPHAVTSAVESPLSDEETPGVVVLAETPLPRLYVPGKIAHIYSHRGVYRAVYVPRSFRELRQISMAGNMLADHKCKAYYEALLEVRTVRLAAENPPRWTAFDEDDTCACCASRFTWASTSNSKAQEARDKHHCRSCGTLVCDACSLNRVPLPSIGLRCAVRVCDRCYHDIDGIVPNTDEVMDDSVSTFTRDSSSAGAAMEKPERVRQRRSEVVDDLASRITTPGWL